MYLNEGQILGIIIGIIIPRMCNRLNQVNSSFLRLD